MALIFVASPSKRVGKFQTMRMK